MSFFRNIFYRISICVMACMIMLASTAFAAEEDVNYIKEVFIANEAINNGQAWMNFTALSPIGKANIELNITGIFKPQLACKGESILTYTAVWGDSGIIKTPFYINEEGGQSVIYWNYDRKWMKAMGDNKEIASRDLVIAAAMAQFEKDSKFIKDAEIVFDNNIQRRVKVLIDGKEMGQLFKTLSNTLTEKEKDCKVLSPQEKIIMDFIYDNLGDLPLFYTIDVNTERITSANGDFSPVIRHVADSAIKQFLPTTPDQKEVIDRLLNSFTFTFDAVYTMHNGVMDEDISIPAEAKNAKDMTLESAKETANEVVAAVKK